MADEPRFVLNGKEYPVPDSFTIGEMCDAERYFGVEFGESATVGARMMAAMMWIAVRREDPTVTVNDIRDLPADAFQAVEAGDARPPEIPASNGNGDAKTQSSGGSSTADSASQDDDQSPIGGLTSAASDLVTSEI
jgi:hypothetical protein